MAFDAIMMVHGWTSIWSKPQDFNLTIEKICDHMDHIAGNARHVGIGSLLAALSPGPGYAGCPTPTGSTPSSAAAAQRTGRHGSTSVPGSWATWLKCFSRR